MSEMNIQIKIGELQAEIGKTINDAFEEGKSVGRADAIDECKQILLDAMARDGKTKCHEYMLAVNEMEQLKEKKNVRTTN